MGLRVVLKALVRGLLLQYGRFDDDYFQESHESSQFRHEFEMRKIKQAGLDALKNMASDMNELDRQVPLRDEIDSKVVNMASQFRA
ncbi:syntaxin-71 [Brassica rapa]|uniref:syntaxin-71 n=1 Tax=Brassica campestris TaxID=3711 RepID=UPI0004F1C4E0|nr:syntaxin-71 [Brassica rapa]